MIRQDITLILSKGGNICIDKTCKMIYIVYYIIILDTILEQFFGICNMSGNYFTTRYNI